MLIQHLVGRMYNHQLLDMVELGIERLVPLDGFKVTLHPCIIGARVIPPYLNCMPVYQSSKCALGAKPCMVFSGDLFELDLRYVTLKSLLIGGCRHGFELWLYIDHSCLWKRLL